MIVEVKNYENLANFKHEFKKGLTQVKGETNSGKSSLVRAIWDFAHNSATEGEISIFSKDKENMEIRLNENKFERNKRTKRYILGEIENNKPGKEKVIKNIDKVNFQLQQERPFLVGETEGEKYSYIIGGKHDIFLEAINNLNKEATANKKTFEIKAKDLDYKDLEILKTNEEIKEIEIFEWKDVKNIIEKSLGKINKLEELKSKNEKIKEIKINKTVDVKEIKNKIEKIKKLKKLEEILTQIKNIKTKPTVEAKEIKNKAINIIKIMRLNKISNEVKNIKIVKTVETEKIVSKFKKVFELKKLEKIVGKIKTINLKETVEADVLKQKSKKLINFSKLKENLNSIEKLKFIETVDIKEINLKRESINGKFKLKKVLQKIREIDQELEKISDLIAEQGGTISRLRKEMKKCPICGTNM